jgi:hypothetical protein
LLFGCSVTYQKWIRATTATIATTTWASAGRLIHTLTFTGGDACACACPAT